VLNPGFSAAAVASCGSGYVLDANLAAAVTEANREFAAGRELRTQPVYGDELWFRLRELGLANFDWDGLDVLDACCGSGFLSYHLLARASPRMLTLLDLNPVEVRYAEQLVSTSASEKRPHVVALAGDLGTNELPEAHFDVVIGNSFLHHFADVPAILAKIFRLLRPGGLFVALHEPTPAAVPWESGDPRYVAAYLLRRERFWRGARYGGPGLLREGTVDVWMFEARELAELVAAQGFVQSRVLPRYLVRPFAVALLGLHLSEERPRLTSLQALILRSTVRTDAVLRRLLPVGVFGGLSCIARRPT
jgi:SAM-dependent methyltransferase